MVNKNLFKRLLSVTVASAMFFAVLLLTSCGGDKNKTLADGLGTKQGSYAFAAVSAGEIISGMDQPSVGATANFVSAGRDSSFSDPEMTEKLDGYMAFAEKILGSDTPVKNEVSVSDRDGYEHKNTVTVTSFSGTQTYIMYYNESLLREQDRDRYGDRDDWFEDDEVETTLSGILVIGEHEYRIEGKREVEGNEMELEFIAFLDENDRVVFEQETETGESEYEYSIYSGGKLIDSFSLEVETGGNEVSVEIQTEDSNGNVMSYELSKKQYKNKNRIRVEFREGNIEREFDVEILKNSAGERICKYYLTDTETEIDD